MLSPNSVLTVAPGLVLLLLGYFADIPFVFHPVSGVPGAYLCHSLCTFVLGPCFSWLGTAFVYNLKILSIPCDNLGSFLCSDLVSLYFCHNIWLWVVPEWPFLFPVKKKYLVSIIDAVLLYIVWLVFVCFLLFLL